MTFSEALDECKKGKKIGREGWNGKYQYVELCRMLNCVNMEGIEYTPDHKAMGNYFLMFVGTQGSQCGWLASQADMLADDWRVF